MASSEAMPDARAALDREIRESVHRYLPLAMHGDDRPPPCTCHIRIGEPVDVILSLADEVGADHIVVATHARVGIEALLHPSVAERVVHRARCSVTCVKVFLD